MQALPLIALLLGRARVGRTAGGPLDSPALRHRSGPPPQLARAVSPCKIDPALGYDPAPGPVEPLATSKESV